jgi:hypothetical protein
MELNIKINQNKKEAKALIAYLQSLPFVSIRHKFTDETKLKNSHASDFVKKWKGFLKNEEIDDARFDYLMKKYG